MERDSKSPLRRLAEKQTDLCEPEKRGLVERARRVGKHTFREKKKRNRRTQERKGTHLDRTTLIRGKKKTSLKNWGE